MRELGMRGMESEAEGCGAERRGCGGSLGARRGSESRIREGRVR